MLKDSFGMDPMDGSSSSVPIRIKGADFVAEEFETIGVC